jgi:hypothetical protein
MTTTTMTTEIKEQYAVCEECGLTCYTGAEHYKAIQNGAEWRCADCDSDYEDRDDSDSDAEQDRCEDAPKCGCCWDDAIDDANADLNAAIDASGNCF